MTNKSDFQPPPVLDLRQNISTMYSTIVLYADYSGYAWIHAGEIDLSERSWAKGQRGVWTLEVKRYGATDYEHDAAVALRVGLTGVSFRMASCGRLWLDGFIDGADPNMFRVPEPDWNQLDGAVKCTHKNCKASNMKHMIVDEGRYIPPPNKALFERLRGLRIEIVTGVVP